MDLSSPPSGALPSIRHTTRRGVGRTHHERRRPSRGAEGSGTGWHRVQVRLGANLWSALRRTRMLSSRSRGRTFAFHPRRLELLAGQQLEAAWMKRKGSARDAALGPGQAIGSWTRAPWSLGRSEHTRSKFAVGACQPRPRRVGKNTSTLLTRQVMESHFHTCRWLEPAARSSKLQRQRLVSEAEEWDDGHPWSASLIPGRLQRLISQPNLCDEEKTSRGSRYTIGKISASSHYDYAGC